ncbi:MAG TPA: DUF4129 domain-containing protein [Nitrososphaerales archaeon]|nr:DUF4129 domain-containing protein [Nitrososphaerales archaeon]
MTRTSDTALLVSVLALAVIVLGAAESGVGPSALAPGGSPPGIHRTSQGGHGTSVTQTIARSTTVRRTTRTTLSLAGTSGVTSGTGVPAAALLQSLEADSWYFLVPAVACLAGGMAALLLRKEKPRIFDLKSVTQQMESQQNYFVGSLSKRLRNAALLRYYVLMAEACAKLGITDSPADTPHEFIGRASLELNVESRDAERFADAVDRAHYGAELSGEEVASASRFMDSFTRTVIGRTDIA